MSGLLGIAAGVPGSGRARYARAMTLLREGRLSEAQLEAYRVASSDDSAGPAAEFARRGLCLPADPVPGPEAAIRTLLDEADRYLAALSGEGIAEVRTGLAGWRSGPVSPGAHANPVVRSHLPGALRALAPTHPGLAAAIATATPWLRWQSYDGYPPAAIGEAFARGHAYAAILGEDAAIPARDFDLGLFLIAPNVLYRDHCHPAPELYAPLTGPHGWRFGPGRPLIVKPAHQPVWNPPMQPHLTKVGAVPFLCLYAWTRDAASDAQVIAADDWDALEGLRLA